MGPVLIMACASSPPLNKTVDLVSVQVLPAGPPVWTYTVETNGAENLVSIEFVSPSELDGCRVVPLPETLEIETVYDRNTIKVVLKGEIINLQRFNQFRRLTVSLTDTTKTRKNGNISIRVTDARGNITVIAPVAGPT